MKNFFIAAWWSWSWSEGKFARRSPRAATGRSLMSCRSHCHRRVQKSVFRAYIDTLHGRIQNIMLQLYVLCHFRRVRRALSTHTKFVAVAAIWDVVRPIVVHLRDVVVALICRKSTMESGGNIFDLPMNCQPFSLTWNKLMVFPENASRCPAA